MFKCFKNEKDFGKIRVFDVSCTVGSPVYIQGQVKNGTNDVLNKIFKIYQKLHFFKNIWFH